MNDRLSRRGFKPTLLALGLCVATTQAEAYDASLLEALAMGPEGHQSVILYEFCSTTKCAAKSPPDASRLHVFGSAGEKITVLPERNSSLAVGYDGRVAVAARRSSDGAVTVQFFDAAGTPTSALIAVSTDRAIGRIGIASRHKYGFVVAWTAADADGKPSRIRARLYDALGTPEGRAIEVSRGADVGESPVVAGDARGRFAVAWASGTGTSQHNIRAARFRATGAALGPAFQVNTRTGEASEPSIASDADGRLAVTWTVQAAGQESDVVLRRFDASGIAAGSEEAVTDDPVGRQSGSVVAMDPFGDVVVAWADDAQKDCYGEDPTIVFRRYGPTGAAQPMEFAASSCDAPTLSGGYAAIDADGDVLVGWSRDYEDANPGLNRNASWRRVAETGVADVGMKLQASPRARAPGGGLQLRFTLTNGATPSSPSGVPVVDRGIGAANGITVEGEFQDGLLSAHVDPQSDPGWSNCFFSFFGFECAYSAPLLPGKVVTLVVDAMAPTTTGPNTVAGVVRASGQDDPRLRNNSATRTLEVRD